jgi:hypothetical protein
MGQQRVLKAIPEFRKSYALVSLDHSADTAVIFVHGFAGSPTGTWLDFHGLIKICSPNYPWWDQADLFFYSYESLRTPILANAEEFERFVLHILSSDATEAVRFPARTGKPHSKLVLVGHSEGAVVIRRWLLDCFMRIEKAHNYKDDPILNAVTQELALNSQLRLFAPACMGTNFSSLLGFANSFSLFSAIASSSLVRNELKPNSPILEPLKTGTENASKRFRDVPAFKAKVLFGKRDQVVHTAAYECDDIDSNFPIGHNHTSICKPGFKYLKPLEFVP